MSLDPSHLIFLSLLLIDFSHLFTPVLDYLHVERLICIRCGFWASDASESVKIDVGVVIPSLSQPNRLEQKTDLPLTGETYQLIVLFTAEGYLTNSD